MAVGKGSIIRASHAGSKTVSGKESDKEERYVHISAGVTRVPVKCLESLEVGEKQKDIDGMVEESVHKYGILEPLLVWHKGENLFVVLDGNKRLQAIKNLGIELVPVFTVDIVDVSQAKEIYQELHRYTITMETVHEYEVLSSISSNVPTYLL